MNLRRDKRQNVQLKLDFRATLTGEARKAETEAAESRPAVHAAENPASTNRLMEEVCERENLKEALRRVKANKCLLRNNLPIFLAAACSSIRREIDQDGG